MERQERYQQVGRATSWPNPLRYGSYLCNQASKTEVAVTAAVTAAGAAGGAAGGAYLASKTGAVVGTGVCPGLGTVGGAVVGAVVGGSFALVSTAYLSSGYRTWVELQLDHQIRTIVLEEANQDPILTTYRCPLTGLIPLEPVQAPDGRFYERLSIEGLARHGTVAQGSDASGNYPIQTFNVNTLQAAPKLKLAILVRLRHLLQVDMRDCSNQLSRAALDRYLRNTNTAITEVQTQINERITRLVAQGGQAVLGNLMDVTTIQQQGVENPIETAFLTWKG